MIHVTAKTEEELSAIPNAAPGDVAVLDNGQIYMTDVKGNWVQAKDYEDSKVELNVSLYDLNRNSITLMPGLTDFTQEKEEIAKFLNKTKSCYYMLLSNDLHYYTVFAIDKNVDDVFEEEVIGCLRDLGSVKLIDATYDDHIECWVTIQDEVSHVLMLFPYERGVIHCH